MKLCHFPALIFSAIFSGVCGAAAPPNFLVLIADDMRADAIHAHGNTPIRTPHLDKLIAEGFSFREAHCLGSNSGAVCVPSRAMLMSGRPWFHVRNDLDGVETLPRTLARRGYETFLAGKWHNGAKSCEAGFQNGSAIFLGGMTDQFHPKLTRLEHGKLLPAQPGAKFSTDAIADAAIEYLSERTDGKPFFAWVSFTVPHDPRTPKPDPAGLYDPATLPAPPNFLPQHPFDQGWLTVRDEELLGWPRTAEAIKLEIANYYALITHLDQRVGDVLQALEKTDATNTFVIFLADHGLALGSHGLLGKQNLYQHSMRAPFIVRGPGVPRGGESSALTYLHDLHATLLSLSEPDAAGSSVGGPASLVESHSLVPLWRGEKTAGREPLLLAFTDSMRAVRDSRWKLIVYPPINHAQLFDLLTDPHEMNDLASRHPERVAALMKRLSDLQAASGDQQPLRVANPKLKEINLSGRKANPRAAIPGGANR